MLDISKLNMCDYELQFDLLECTMNIYGVHNYYVILMCQKKLKCNFINYCGFFLFYFLKRTCPIKKTPPNFKTIKRQLYNIKQNLQLIEIPQHV